MPITPNYAFEKRQRELAKKKKLEEKKTRKRETAGSTAGAPAQGMGGSAGAGPRRPGA